MFTCVFGMIFLLTTYLVDPGQTYFHCICCYELNEKMLVCYQFKLDKNVTNIHLEYEVMISWITTMFV
jgi:hypothetical protein